MQVKVIMPPKDGIMRKTPTGKAVGRKNVWHNFGYHHPTFYVTNMILSILLYFLYGFSLGSENGLILNFSVSCVVRREVQYMMDMDFFQLLYNHLEERRYNNICQNAKQDTNYLKATMLENELNAEYEKLDLSDEQRNVIMQWIDAIHAQEAAYTVVAFRMGMQCCFSLLMQLADL